MEIHKNPGVAPSRTKDSSIDETKDGGSAGGESRISIPIVILRTVLSAV